MTAPSVLVHRDRDELAAAVGARLITRLADAQSQGDAASVVLTGGGVGTAVLASIATSPARGAIDWSRLDVWWGDERFLPAGDAERNHTQARAALLDAVPLNPARVHPMPPSDGPAGDDPEAAAADYATQLERAGRPEDPGPTPAFDVLLLGVGPDGHVASLFPGLPALNEKRSVVAVRAAPKPPPVRISLTLPTINAAREVWLVVGGSDKADAVALALSDKGRSRLPAAQVQGRDRTVWMLDRDAAANLPPGRARPPSP